MKKTTLAMLFAVLASNLLFASAYAQGPDEHPPVHHMMKKPPIHHRYKHHHYVPRHVVHHHAPRKPVYHG
ncbi:MAG: hypothetical protein P4L95_01970 [Rouxiella aceris]|uniref:hypothetical protein n=1 Tax=Rouxiella aceris TaxID=2703884 RepID=UPI00283AE1A6|nr:hypothetical protein [Rouxiella aceris]MDR3430666.1 hypothetical protein [Rouxiella aceris]